MLCVMLNARGSEVAGLEVGDIHWVNRIVKIERQVYPGKGGLVRKQAKGRKDRYVPILDPSAPSSSASPQARTRRSAAAEGGYPARKTPVIANRPPFPGLV